MAKPNAYPVGILETLEIPRAEVNALVSFLGLDPKELDKGISPGMLMLILVYRALTVSMHQTQAIFVIKHFLKPLANVGLNVHENGKHEMVMLNVADARYVYMHTELDETSIIDLAQMAPVEDFPIPAIQLSLVLPELYSRAVGILAESQDEPAQAAVARDLRQVVGAALQQTPQQPT